MDKNKTSDYAGFNQDLTKEDLNEDELKCYNKLMEGISETSKEEKDEVAHLMDVFLETEEKTYTHCARCHEELSDDGEENIYCDKCLSKMWGDGPK